MGEKSGNNKISHSRVVCVLGAADRARSRSRRDSCLERGCRGTGMGRGKGMGSGGLAQPQGSRCPAHPERGSQGWEGAAGGSLPTGAPPPSPRASPELLPPLPLRPPGLPLPPLAPSSPGAAPRCPSPVPTAGAVTRVRSPGRVYLEIGSLSACRRLARIDVSIAPRAGFGAKEIKIKLSVAKR